MSHENLIECPKLSPHARYRWDAARKQHQLLYPEGLLVLNHTGAAILKLCDGRPLIELVDALDAEFESGCQLDDVAGFLADLVERGLIQDGNNADR